MSKVSRIVSTLMTQIGKILVSGSKTAILEEVAKGPEGFGDLLKNLDETSGNLNYHLLTLQKDGLIDKKDNKYVLTTTGKDALKIIERVAKS